MINYIYKNKTDKDIVYSKKSTREGYELVVYRVKRETPAQLICSYTTNTGVNDEIKFHKKDGSMVGKSRDNRAYWYRDPELVTFEEFKQLAQDDCNKCIRDIDIEITLLQKSLTAQQIKRKAAMEKSNYWNGMVGKQ